MSTPRPTRRALGSLPGNIEGDSILDDRTPARRNASMNMLGRTPPRQSGADMDSSELIDIDVGDGVEVPGGMTGTVKFVGTVEGKRGTFAGVELSKEFAARGKNDGDVDGVRYFVTSVPGSGIFLPLHRAVKLASPASRLSFAPTPTTPMHDSRPSTGRTPPSSSKLGQTGPARAGQPVPAARAPSPVLKNRIKRPSLPRPESPLRKAPPLQPTPAGSVRSRPSNLGSNLSPAARKSATPARPLSRAQSRQGQVDSPDNTPVAVRPKPSLLGVGRRSTGGVDEVQRLQKVLDDRDKQLKEQTSMLAEMESSMAELQSIIAANSKEPPAGVDADTGDADAGELRGIVKAKQEKIEFMQKQFDSHRADFRSTIDMLEMAATETERLYERQMVDLQKENEELRRNQEDVATITNQFKAFEEHLAELEESVELARREEAEAKSEAEFLHGEVERLRLELRREREKAAKAVQGASEAVGDDSGRELEERDDEIRGLKAIIHSLSSGPDPNTPQRDRAVDADAEAALKAQVATLEREKSELRGLAERKTFEAEDVYRENARLRAAAGIGENGDAYANYMHRNSTASTATAIRPESDSYATQSSQPSKQSQSQSQSQASQPQSSRPTSSRRDKDTVSATDGGSTEDEEARCELCQQNGHGMLTCPRLFDKTPSKVNGAKAVSDETPRASAAPTFDDAAAAAPPVGDVADGPLAGKASGVVDMDKWCALCERDGHASVDCPLDEF